MYDKYKRLGTKKEGILMIPIIDPKLLKYKSKKDNSLCVNPPGEIGYNIVFSTEKSFCEILDSFKNENLLNYNSLIASDDKEIGLFNYILNDLSDKLLKKLNKKKKFKVFLTQDKEALNEFCEINSLETKIELDKSKISYFWYDTNHMFFDSNTFAINFGQYNKKFIQAAARYTNYNLTYKDRKYICSKFK